LEKIITDDLTVVIPAYEKEITIVIPSCKKEITTLGSLDSCPVEYELVVSKVAGLGYCRNDGVRKAKTDFIVMFDDDIILSPEVWHHILSVKRGEFAMAFLSGFPCSRVVAIHTEDFWRIGGFDESIKFTGEDRDFYVRALLAGLKFKEIPLRLIQHREHLTRCKNIYVGIGGARENMRFLLRYGRRFPKVFRVDFLDRIKRGQARTLLLQFIFIIYLILKGENRVE
jgi:glycosyltransferase involved in cell wall biosynthesis